MIKGRKTVFILLGLLLLCPFLTARAEMPVAKEYAVKAAFLYNFAKFIDWPQEALMDAATFNICVLGENPFGPSLEALRAKGVKGRPLKVILKNGLADGQRCHIVFVSKSETDRLDDILKSLSLPGVLLVSDVEGFAHRGGMIHLFMEERKVRFSVNLEATKHAGLKISSKLLRLAEIVNAKD